MENTVRLYLSNVACARVGCYHCSLCVLILFKSWLPAAPSLSYVHTRHVMDSGWDATKWCGCAFDGFRTHLYWSSVCKKLEITCSDSVVLIIFCIAWILHISWSLNNLRFFRLFIKTLHWTRGSFCSMGKMEYIKKQQIFRLTAFYSWVQKFASLMASVNCRWGGTNFRGYLKNKWFPKLCVCIPQQHNYPKHKAKSTLKYAETIACLIFIKVSIPKFVYMTWF